MENTAIDTAEAVDINGISQRCGEVTVGCSDVAGVVDQVLRSFAELRDEHAQLAETVKDLDKDQQKVTEACDESRMLSERALQRLGEGRSHIRASLEKITGLLEAVETLAQHITGFAAAMDQVKRSSQEIEAIADKTNILALNAAIEAHRAGDAGRTFSVVATEVKSLAGDAHIASNEITRTIEALAGEAEQVMGKISKGAEQSSAAKQSVNDIETTIGQVCDLIVEVDGQNDQIVRNNAQISEHVHKVQDVMNSFGTVVGTNERRLHRAHDRIEDLELTASGMFDALVKAGLSPVDSMMVDTAQAHAREILEITQKAVESGEVSMGALFDTDYDEIAGSDPKRYRTRLTGWADRVWRPLLDRYTDADPRVAAVACTDMNGFLPTHLSKHSQQPTGDLAHDTEFCRNGRIILDAIDARAKRSSDDYMMAVYRREADGDGYMVVRNVYVPLIIEGKRWGDLEMAYILD